MGRPKKQRQSSYKTYFEKGHLEQQNFQVPPTTLRSREVNDVREEMVAPPPLPQDPAGSSHHGDSRDDGVDAGCSTRSEDDDEELVPDNDKQSSESEDLQAGVLQRCNEQDMDRVGGFNTTSDSPDDQTEYHSTSENGPEMNGLSVSPEVAPDAQLGSPVMREDSSVNPSLYFSPERFSPMEQLEYQDQEEGDQSDVQSIHSDDARVMLPSPVSINDETDDERGNAHDDIQDMEPAEEVEHPQMQPTDIEPFGRLKKELTDNYGKVISEQVTATYGEVLLNALELCKHHNFNHSAKSNVMKFVNTIFGNRVLPDTRYLLDALFFSRDFMSYHFFCKTCSTELENELIDDTVKWINCPNIRCRHRNHVGVLEESSFFVVFDLPYQIKVLLDKPDLRAKLVSPFDFNCTPADITDLYDGECYRKFSSFLHLTDKGRTYRYLSFTLCTDGSGLYSNSPCSIWPCFLMLNELPPVIRMGNLLVAGLWFGPAKAKMDLFLRPIIKKINDLSNQGFTLHFSNQESWNLKAYLIACCVDSGARGDVQGNHSHRGEFGCNWCLIPGIEWVNARRYPFSFPFHADRTLHQMLRDAEIALATKRVINGVKGPSQLAGAAMFDVVKGMVVDYMHAVAEGNGKAFLNLWVSYECYLGGDDKEAVEKRIKQVKPPFEVRKYLRPLNCYKYWTGREWENWVLYFSVPILADILPEKYLKNWCLFVQSVHLLSCSTISIAMLNEAHLLLIAFVSGVQSLYGMMMMRYNVHIMLHLAENVKRWGPLFAVNSFAFEHGMQKFKSMVHANKGIPSQICRQIAFDQAIDILRTNIQSNNCASFSKSLESNRFMKERDVNGIKLLGASIRYTNLTGEERWLCASVNLDPSNCLVFKKIKKDSVIYEGIKTRISKTDNSVCNLIDGRTVKLKYFVMDEYSKSIWAVASNVHVRPYEMCPASTVRIGIKHCFLLRVTHIDEDISFLPVNLLGGLLVNMTLSNGNFLAPLANICNIY